MTTSKQKAAAGSPSQRPINEAPINVIHDRLDQASATLDLIYALAAGGDGSSEPIESLREGTLSSALRGAMIRIEEALEAAGELNSEVRHGQA